MKECSPLVAACCRTIGIPEPVCEFQFHPKRKWKFDFAWPELKIALEIEGGVWKRGGGRHNRGKGFLRDLEKYNEATQHGWRLLRTTPELFEDGSAMIQVRRLVRSVKSWTKS